MVVDEKMIRHVSELAKIELSETEIHAMIQDMEKILGFVERLQDTPGATEDTRPQCASLDDLREDVAQPSLKRDVALSIAPEASDEGYLVPQIIE